MEESISSMQYRRLGRAGVRVSTIALGSWLTYGGPIAEEAAIQCIHTAYDLGINLFDTANVYQQGALCRGLRVVSNPDCRRGLHCTRAQPGQDRLQPTHLQHASTLY